MLGDNSLGVQHNADGARVVIEEFMAGEEASFIVIADGTHVLALATSQDHKRIGDGDTGPNTGGMGAYSPAPVVTPNVHAKVMHEIVSPTLAGMAREGTPFTGFLYAGLMIDAQGHAAHGGVQLPAGRPRGRGHPDAPEERPLRGADARHRRHAGPGGAAVGPPHRAGRGDGRRRLPGHAAQGRRDQRRAAPADDLKVFHAGTTLADGQQMLTSGGRVLCVTALGDSVRLAQQRAWRACTQIHFAGAQWRSDIGHRALKH